MKIKVHGFQEYLEGNFLLTEDFFTLSHDLDRLIIISSNLCYLL